MRCRLRAFLSSVLMRGMPRHPLLLPFRQARGLFAAIKDVFVVIEGILFSGDRGLWPPFLADRFLA